MHQLDRSILRLAVPALGSLAIEPLYVLVDTAIVGRLPGASAAAPLGGLALASTVLTTAFWAFNFLAYGTTARVAFLVGARNTRAAAGAAVQALWLALAIGGIVALAVAAFAANLASALGGSGDVLHAAATYLRISAPGVPFVLVALVGNGYLRGVADTRTPLLVVLVANVLNVVLEVWFVYGLRLGIAGSALGTLIAQAVAAAWFLVLIARAVRRRGAAIRPDGAELRLLATSGHQLVVRTGALLATLAVATSVAARVGPSTLAAHQIAIQMWAFLALAVDALAIAAQTMVATALGAEDPAAARAVGTRVLRMSLAAGAALGVAVAASSRWLPALFTDRPSVSRIAATALLGVGITQLPGAAVFALDGILMGASDFRFLKWGTLAGLAAFLPFAAAVLARPSLGMVGIWAGLASWLCARLAVNGSRFAGARWWAAAVRTS